MPGEPPPGSAPGILEKYSVQCISIFSSLDIETNDFDNLFQNVNFAKANNTNVVSQKQ